MTAPTNPLKQALEERRLQIGLWLAMASPVAAEIAAHAGFDWCLIDAEHGPNELTSILSQLHAMNGAPAHPVVRVPIGEARILKQVLDLGVQSLLVPMVDTSEEAARMVRAVRYPPRGVRGVGAGLARASGYSRLAEYAVTADAQVCLLVQAESRRAIENIDAIAATEGVDGVFIGPADLSADMGHPNRPDAPEVVEAIDHAISRIRAADKAAGIVTFEPERIGDYARQGVTFLGVGGDTIALARALAGLAAIAREAAGSG
ncbi:HpcH/HpaI aldolase family protein [Roseitranquillus sediminis]|uniref:HpcH/HpaI aldolase family protein n=1 Tax=Roseitranquillus sediminis TaxID=2809051 RepID=UPI001D0CB539|nr:HpcH/HpaI aldolase/citrate lyase family protein [Roseitranquillus sediminis]MBM9595709.1 HpcH/HpaI aldolase/citrate lyase family protein [Roseitranquillus sediminis]